MKTYKQIDLITGCVLIIISILLTLFSKMDFYFMGYFIVGGWQIISAIAHTVLKQHYIYTSYRKVYEIAVIVFLIAGLIAFASVMSSGNFVIYFMYFLLYFSPVLAIYYQIVCFIEYRRLTKRAFIHLKN